MLTAYVMKSPLPAWCRVVFASHLIVVAALAAGPVPQSITFPASPEKTYGDAPVALNATASSGLPVTYARISGNGTVSGNTLTLTGGGAIVVEATQAGNDTYATATPVRQTITVKPRTVTITVPNVTVVYDGLQKSMDAQITSNPSLPVYRGDGGPDGLLVSYNGSPVNGPTFTQGKETYPRGSGVYTVRAEAFSWLERYIGTGSGTFTITRMPVALTLGNLSQAYDGRPKPVSVNTIPTTVYYPNGAVPMSQYLTITYNGSTGAPTEPGSYEVVATVDGPDCTGSARATLTITKTGQAQTITFPAIAGTKRSS
jgi:hypothetical protein